MNKSDFQKAMSPHKRTVIAVILNLVLPGLGYLYVRSLTRLPLAIFLVLGTLLGTLRTSATIGQDGVFHVTSMHLLFPVEPFGVIVATLLAADVYFLARKQDPKNGSGKFRWA